jgi:hypothetical protein
MMIRITIVVAHQTSGTQLGMGRDLGRGSELVFMSILSHMLAQYTPETRDFRNNF